MFGVLACLRAYMSDVLACLCACMLGAFMFSLVWGACVLTYLLVCVLRMLACFISIRFHMSYTLAVLRYFMRLRTYVLGVLVCSISFTFEKLNSENSYVDLFFILRSI